MTHPQACDVKEKNKGGGELSRERVRSVFVDDVKPLHHQALRVYRMEGMTWPKSVTAHLTSRCIVSRWHMANPLLLNLCHPHKRLALASSRAPHTSFQGGVQTLKPQKSQRGALISPIYTCQMGEGCTPACVPRHRHAPFLERAEV